MLKNINFVEYKPQCDTSWTFIITGKSTRLSEVSNELLDITKSVLDISKDIFMPTKVCYGLMYYSRDAPANEYFKEQLPSGLIHIGVIRREIESENGITFEALMGDVGIAMSLDVPIEILNNFAVLIIGMWLVLYSLWAGYSSVVS